MSRSTPTINDKILLCLSRKLMGLPATTSFVKWTPSEGNKRGTGTSGKTTHNQNSCQAERNFSALAHLSGDLHSNMLASKVERMMFIRLSRHMVLARSKSLTPRTHRHELGWPRVHRNRRRRSRRGQSCRLTFCHVDVTNGLVNGLFNVNI